MTFSEFQILMKLPKYAVEIGVFEDKTNRKRKNKGVTNSRLLFIHEFGSAKQKIPARPVLRYTIEWAKPQVNVALLRAVRAYIKSGFQLSEYEKELERFCVRIQSHARKMIYANDGTFVANAPRTIAKKGDNHPLFDTGQMARSITCRLVKL